MQSTAESKTLVKKVQFDPDYLAAFQKKLFIEGPLTARRLSNFFVLLLLATVIATFGVIGDSTATVIGAMIVAPLMGPIMATAAAIVMGSARRALRALALVVVGVAAVIFVSFLLALVVPGVNISFQENSQITSRVTPGLVALLTALASGAAGAYIMSREEIADSMGGVAIAISLVPPLCVVGIGIGEGEWQSALGAMTLFLTNFLAILLAGGLTFMLGGLGGLVTKREDVRMRNRSFALVIVATLLLAIPLSITTYQAIRSALDTRSAGNVVNLWLEGTAYEPLRVEVYGNRVITYVVGSGDAPSIRTLADAMAVALKRPVVVNLRVTPSLIEASSVPAP
jgi:uncharacterized hydrophobic protein (TIGR00271 family)